MSIPRISVLPSVDASRVSARQDARNSAFAEGLRRRLQALLPYGAGRRMSGRLAGSCGPHGVEEQVEGRGRLSVDVFVEGLRELPDEAARALADELLAPRGLAAVPRGDIGTPAGLLAANAELLRSIAHLEAALSAAVADGEVDQAEARELARTIVEARTRLQHLESVVFGGVR